MEKKIAQREHSLFGYLFYGQCADYARTVQTCVCNSGSQYFQIRFRLSAKQKLFLGLHLCSMYVLLEHVLWKCISLHVLQLLHNYYIGMCNCDFLSTVFRVTQIFKGRLVKLNLLGFLNLKNILSEKRPLCNYIINPLEILVLCQMRHE